MAITTDSTHTLYEARSSQLVEPRTTENKTLSQKLITASRLLFEPGYLLRREIKEPLRPGASISERAEDFIGACAFEVLRAGAYITMGYSIATKIGENF